MSQTREKKVSYKRNYIFVALLAVIMHTSLGAEQISTIEVLTEITPFTTPELLNNHSGEATVFVERVLKEAKIDYNISYIPWKRSYQYALAKPNILIYPLARTQQRELDFIWVGNIIPVNYYLFKLKIREDIALKSVSEARHYAIGVVNKHAHHEYLMSKGFTEFQTVNNSTQNLRKLLLGRIDLFAMSSGGLEPLCSQLRVDCSQVVPAIALDDFSGGLYMAFSKNSDQDIVEKVKTAYQTEIAGPNYASLFAHRLNIAKKIETSLESQR